MTDQTLLAQAMYSAEMASILYVQWGLLLIAFVSLLGAAWLIFSLRLRTHEQAKEVLRLCVEVESLRGDVDTQRARRRKAQSDLLRYHRRVEPLVVQVEAMASATNDIERAAAFREARHLVKEVPRERKKAA